METDEVERIRLRAMHASPFLAALAVGPSLYLGGAPAPSVGIFATLALLTLLVAGVDLARARRDPLARAAALVVAVAFLQVLPLPPIVVRFFDPRAATLSATALSPFQLDRDSVFRALHMDPGNGYASLQYLVGLFAAYLAAERVTFRGRGASVLDAVSWAPLAVAALALMHRGLGLERVYALYAPTQADPPILSPLLNANHLAAVTGAGTVLWVSRAVAAQTLPARVVRGAGAALCGAVCALSLSRGGVASALGGVLLFVLSVRLMSDTRSDGRARQLISLAAVASAALAAGVYVGWEALRREYVAGDMTKVEFIRGSLRPLAHHWFLGVGAGGLSAATAVEGALPGGFVVERAESLPVDLALAFGPAVALVVLVLAARWLWSVRPLNKAAGVPHLGAFAALVTLVAHDMLDFALWLGAAGYLAAMLAGWLSGNRNRTALGPHARHPRPRRAVLVPLVLCSIAATFVTTRSPLYVDHDRVQAEVSSGVFSYHDLQRAMVRHPADAYLPLAGGAVALRSGDRRALRFVNRAMELAPRWDEPHVLLARVLAAHGLSSQALVEVRYAASVSPRHHGPLASVVVALTPAPDVLERVVPDGALGTEFLRAVGNAAQGLPYSSEADALLLRRDPDNLRALLREAGRADVRGDQTRRVELLQRVVRGHPASAEGYASLADAKLSTGDAAGAEAVLRTGVARCEDTQPLLFRLAQAQARRHDVTAMRATMQEVLDTVGADVDKRITAYGQLASLEQSLGNVGAALVAFDRGDGMANPNHPYISQIVALSAQVRDLPRLRAACGTLRDLGQYTDANRQTCALAEARGAVGGAMPRTGEANE